YNNVVSSLNGTASLEVNTAAFGNGMYFVNVASNDSKSSKKLMIKN
ncbi:MAG: T9SS type A sorting domain-containing protein, partial [Bacteroidetes bacterium]|nr:T9SS type A sorting domain-containing protein [Bacteroidota bacterium]